MGGSDRAMTGMIMLTGPFHPEGGSTPIPPAKINTRNTAIR